jgi:uncharacterized protein (DUF1697 family)
MGPQTTGVDTHVALLRGVNVGGKNRLPMAALRAILVDLGCTGVATYIQSGNAVYAADDGLAARIPDLVAEQIAAGFGLQVPVVTRTAAELRDVVEGNPFVRGGADPATLYVAFLAEHPEPDAVFRLDPERSPPDAFTVRGREVYLSLPNGAARTRLSTGYLDSRLATTSTVRNWRTVLRLAEMARERG